MSQSITLQRNEGAYTVSRLNPDDAIPSWADGRGFVSITRTDEELSIVCLTERVPPGVRAEIGWTCYKFLGPFAFEAAGIILAVVRPLSENGMGVFVLSTFDGDIILLKSKDANIAERILNEAGHLILHSTR